MLFQCYLNVPRPIKTKIIVRVLLAKGFFFVSQHGSHAKYRRKGNPTRTVIVKISKKKVPYGTFQAILLQAGLDEGDFRDK